MRNIEDTTTLFALNKIIVDTFEKVKSYSEPEFEAFIGMLIDSYAAEYDIDAISMAEEIYTGVRQINTILGAYDGIK